MILRGSSSRSPSSPSILIRPIQFFANNRSKPVLVIVISDVCENQYVSLFRPSLVIPLRRKPSEPAELETKSVAISPYQIIFVVKLFEIPNFRILHGFHAWFIASSCETTKTRTDRAGPDQEAKVYLNHG